MDLGALFGTTPYYTDVALLVGRVAIGVCFMFHAFGKLGWIGNGTLDGFGQWLADTRGRNREQAVEDIFWILFNSPEFSWNH